MRKKKQAVLKVLVVALMLFVPVLSIAGSLEPSAAPGPTMKTMDEVYSTKSWSKKISCDSTTNCPRFEVLADFNNEAVLDKETGLVWAQWPRVIQSWGSGVSFCAIGNIGNRYGWRLPTIQELGSLVDSTRSNPSLPPGQPFVNVQSSLYWSATTNASNTNLAWYGYFTDGYVMYDGIKNFFGFVWCVRGGQGYDGQ